MIRRLPIALFVVTAAIGLAMSGAVYRAGKDADRVRFARQADAAVDRIAAGLDGHRLLLHATAALFDAEGAMVDGPKFRSFVDSLARAEVLDGVQGIGFARWLPLDRTIEAERDIVRNYGFARQPWPVTGEDRRAVIVLLEPQDARNHAAIGYDMFAEARRRAAIQHAMRTREIAASAPVELVQEITTDKQAGFLAYLPVAEPADSTVAGNDDGISGFVYAPFRLGDLFRSALDREPMLPLVVSASDSGETAGGEIYRSDGWTGGSVAAEESRTLSIGGRTWDLRFRPTPAFEPGDGARNAAFLAAVSLLLAVALAVSVRAQLASLDAARRLAEVARKTVDEKDLLLQEMKHRIKNAIARILAIARHTEAASPDLPTFSASFSSRLMAMSAAQDIVVRSASGSAELGTLVDAELRQVSGDGQAGVSASGPPVELNERAAQALGLVFHELSTNALKYGSLSGTDAALQVTWRLAEDARGRSLHIEWREPGAGLVDTSRTGFGTRLIDASIRGELGGTIERRDTDGSRIVDIVIPAAAIA